jgi:hypothetical protein
VSEEIYHKVDMITMNYFPISVSHSNLTICNDQNFPQVLSNEFILQILQIFSFATSNSSMRCGYDSLGAGCLINHLHCEIIFLDDLKNIPVACLPIETREKKFIFSTKLIHKSSEEISTFDENVKIEISSINYPLFAWKIEAFVFYD